MKYFHRTSVAPGAVVDRARRYFSDYLALASDAERALRFSGSLGVLSVAVMAEGGHYTLVTVETNQPGESELDKIAKRFLGVVHTMAEPAHQLRGSY